MGIYIHMPVCEHVYICEPCKGRDSRIKPLVCDWDMNASEPGPIKGIVGKPLSATQEATWF